MNILNEILLSIVSLSFLALTITLIVAIISSTKKIEKIQKDISKLSDEGVKLIQYSTNLSEELQKKSESLDFIFEYLDQFNKKKDVSNSNNVSNIFDLISKSIIICNKISGDIKKYVKS
jgi:uncharacterized protein YoxC